LTDSRSSKNSEDSKDKEETKKKKKIPLKNNAVARSISNAEYQDLKNEDTVVFFFKATCPFCKDLIPVWNKVSKFLPLRWQNSQSSSSSRNSDDGQKDKRAPTIVRMDMTKYNKVKNDIGFPTVPMIAMYKKGKPVVFITTKDRMAANLITIIENYYKGGILPKDPSETKVGTRMGQWPRSPRKSTPKKFHEDSKSHRYLSLAGGQVSSISNESNDSRDDESFEKEKQERRDRDELRAKNEIRARDESRANDESRAKDEQRKRELSEQRKRDEQRNRDLNEQKKREEQRNREEQKKRELNDQKRARENDERMKKRGEELEQGSKTFNAPATGASSVASSSVTSSSVTSGQTVAAPARMSTIASRSSVAYGAQIKRNSVMVSREELKVKELQSELDISRRKISDLEQHLKWYQEQNKLLMDRLEREQENNKRLRKQSVLSNGNSSHAFDKSVTDHKPVQSAQEQMLGKFLETLVQNKNKI
jgi:thiol-disulfide isomerase/thioredoxin